MKLLVLTKYGQLGASSRLRFLQYLPLFKQAGFDITVKSFFLDNDLYYRYEKGRYSLSALLAAYSARLRNLWNCKKFDLIWIEKEALPWFPASFERMLLRGVPYVLDFDDALFHNYDLHRSPWVRGLLGLRIDHLMAGARLVVGGNDYLARRARDAGAPWVEVVPTVIDLARYVAKPQAGKQETVPRLVWIGSPSTVKYLAGLEAPLAALARRFPFKLRVIGGTVNIPGVNVECVRWTEDSEVESIAQCDIGIMPLADSPWERGKCGYKLIQYMACGLAVVASPIGVNTKIVEVGVNGFLAREPDDWVATLGQLLSDAHLRENMGHAGRRLVEKEYCVQQVAPRLVNLLLNAGNKKICVD